MPKLGTPFPFPQPAREFEIVLGKYYKDSSDEIRSMKVDVLIVSACNR